MILRKENWLMKEDAISYLLYKNYLIGDSKIFFKFNTTKIVNKNWIYYCGTDIDVLEITKANVIIGYELKGYRKYKKRYEPPSPFEGLSQTFQYLNLPYVMKNNRNAKSEVLFDGGIFDFVYLVHAQANAEFPSNEKRIFGITPIGFIIVTPDGKFHKVQEAKNNPIQSKEAKEHFLKNLDSLEQFSVNSRIFRKIQRIGELSKSDSV